MDSNRLGQRFAHFGALLFKAEGLEVDFKPTGTGGVVPDLLIRSPTGATAVVEMKLYRSHSTPVSALTQAAVNIEFSRRALQANRSIIVLGGEITPLAHEALKQFPELVVYDIGILAFLVAKHPTLIGTFEEIIREALVFSEPIEPSPKEVNIEADLTLSLMEASVTLPVIVRKSKGDDLCKEINAVGSGRPSAKKFEEKVIEALKYIFDNDLTAWSPQKKTDTSLSFYDLVARVASGHDFWNSIVSQFRSRYIVFEFKNYSAKIKQGQIYTTEKYLFGTALRSTAIIISRNGADANALAAARGALRENGKLIVNLDIKDLCDMLHLKDEGDDHNTILVERVDDMLMKLER
jgi:hypothetical protein